MCEKTSNSEDVFMGNLILGRQEKLQESCYKYSTGFALHLLLIFKPLNAMWRL